MLLFIVVNALSYTWLLHRHGQIQLQREWFYRIIAPFFFSYYIILHISAGFYLPRDKRSKEDRIPGLSAALPLSSQGMR